MLSQNKEIGGRNRYTYDWMEDEIGNFARNVGVEFDDIVFPWSGNPEWDPVTFARKNLVAVGPLRSCYEPVLCPQHCPLPQQTV